MSHLGVENPLRRVVIGLKRGAGDGLLVAKFFQGDDHGAGMLSAHVDSGGLCFRGGRDDVSDGFAEDVDGSVDAGRVEPA